jgi:hypothetical protein
MYVTICKSIAEHILLHTVHLLLSFILFSVISQSAKRVCFFNMESVHIWSIVVRQHRLLVRYTSGSGCFLTKQPVKLIAVDDDVDSIRVSMCNGGNISIVWVCLFSMLFTRRNSGIRTG